MENLTTDHLIGFLDDPSPAVIDFWAPWCGPCRAVTPVVEELAGEHGEIRFVKVNIDDEPEIAQRFGVMSIPTLISFANGTQTGAPFVGAAPKARIDGWIKEQLGA